MVKIAKIFVFVFVVVVGAAPSEAQTSGCMTKGMGYNEPIQVLNSATIQDCANTCINTPKCDFYSYDLEGGSEMCNLYNVVDSSMLGWRSGPKGCVPGGK